MSLEPVDTMLGLVAALSEGQRTIAHLVILLGLPVAAGLVYLIYRARRRDETRERHRAPEDR
jgi:hypothetical protein